MSQETPTPETDANLQERIKCLEQELDAERSERARLEIMTAEKAEELIQFRALFDELAVCIQMERCRDLLKWYRDRPHVKAKGVK